MTLPPKRPLPPQRAVAEQPVDLLMRALQAAVPMAFLDLLLDRIEARR
jgi:hypothetical protein